MNPYRDFFDIAEDSDSFFGYESHFDYDEYIENFLAGCADYPEDACSFFGVDTGF